MTDHERDELLNGIEEVREALCDPQSFEVDEDGNVLSRTQRPDGLVRVVVSQSVTAVPRLVEWSHEFAFGTNRHVTAEFDFEFSGQEKPSRSIIWGGDVDPPLGHVGLLYSVEVRT